MICPHSVEQNDNNIRRRRLRGLCGVSRDPYKEREGENEATGSEKSGDISSVHRPRKLAREVKRRKGMAGSWGLPDTSFSSIISPQNLQEESLVQEESLMEDACG